MWGGGLQTAAALKMYTNEHTHTKTQEHQTVGDMLHTRRLLFVLTGSHDWVGSDFAINAGVGLVVKMKDSLHERGVTILEHVKAAFERDWRSRYAKSLQGNKDQHDKYRYLNQGKIRLESKEENEWSNPL